MTGDDEAHMRAALHLGRRHLGLTSPNPSVGCVIVRDGRVIGRGVTQRGGRPHGETTAIAHALAASGPDATRGATAYVTLEPCSHFGRTGPCVDALARAGIVRVVCATGDPDPRVHGRGFAMLASYGIRVETGCLGAEARLDHRGHMTRVRLGRPFVTLKLALTADGHVATGDRRPVPITGAAANARVHLMRADADAIMVGVGTVKADDPALTVRLPGMADRSPLRVIMDDRFATPLSARIITTVAQGPTWIIGGGNGDVAAETALRQAGCEVMRVEADSEGRLDAGAALRLLATRGITRLMVEGGPTLADRLLRADLIDEVVLFRSSHDLATLRPGASTGLPAFTNDDTLNRFALAASEILGLDRVETYRRSP